MKRESLENKEQALMEFLEEYRGMAFVPIVASDCVPIWEKRNLTIKEASMLFGIGTNKLYSMVKEPECNYVIYVGSKAMIKRVPFENYLEAKTTYSI